MKIHNTVPLPCEECGKLFKTKTNLGAHKKLVHTNVRNFKCQHCEKAFATLPRLKRHVRSVHIRDTFVCEQCGFKSSRVDNLNIHRRSNHGLLKPISRLEHDELVGKGEHPYCPRECQKTTEF